MNSSIPTAMSATDVPKVSSNGTKSMLEKFKKFDSKNQAEFIKDCSTVHVKTVKTELKGKTRKTRDPDAPKRPQSEGVLAWHEVIRQTQEDSGMVLDDDGEPLMKLDPKTNEMKPVYNLTWREAMSKASERKKALEATGGAGAPKPKAAAKKKISDGSDVTDLTTEFSSMSLTQTKAVAKKAAATNALVSASLTKPSSSRLSKLSTIAKPRAPPPPPTIEEDDDNESYISYEEALEPWSYKGVEYLAGTKGERYKQNPDGSRGDWVGYWNEKTRKMEPGKDPNA